MHRRVVVGACRAGRNHETNRLPDRGNAAGERRPGVVVEPAGPYFRRTSELLFRLTRTQALAAGAVPLTVDLLEDPDRGFLKRAADVHAGPAAAARVIDLEGAGAQFEHRDL